MSGYPLKAVLDLRRREEEAAAARLADATRERAAAEAEDLRRVAEVAAARARWERARDEGAWESAEGAAASGAAVSGAAVSGAAASGAAASGAVVSGAAVSGAAVSGAAAAERSRFVTRRRDEVKRVEAALSAFRSGPLAKARAAETTARDLHLAARQARETFDKHEAKFRAGQRKIAERREEETLDDVARVARHPRDDRH